MSSNGKANFGIQIKKEAPVLRKSLEELGSGITVHMMCILWNTLFSRISNSLDNLPVARGDTSNESTLGYEIIAPDRIELCQDNCRWGIGLEMSFDFEKIISKNCYVYQQ